jgi:hypothetical protein
MSSDLCGFYTLRHLSHNPEQRSQLFERLKEGWTDSMDRDQYVMELFEYQYVHNPIYRDFCRQLRKSTENVGCVSEIPFLPISAFKHHRVVTGIMDTPVIFLSSGTTAQHPSRHYVADIHFYLQHTVRIWQNHFGDASQYCFLALLPGYLERKGSSLIAMIQHFISLSSYEESGFYLYNHSELFRKLEWCRLNHIPVVLWGVTYSLLDFCENYPLEFPDLTVVETGGMKGQREEMSREAFHEVLKNRWNVSRVVSEYGMTELMSQAYTQGGLSFSQNDYLSVSVHQTTDPLTVEKIHKPAYCRCWIWPISIHVLLSRRKI